MRLWTARIFLLSAFSLLMAHDLVRHGHHHTAASFNGHDHENENKGSHHHFIFGQLDHSFIGTAPQITLQKHVIADLIILRSFDFTDGPKLWLKATFRIELPDKPPLWVFQRAETLRGPPNCQILVVVFAA